MAQSGRRNGGRGEGGEDRRSYDSAWRGRDRRRVASAIMGATALLLPQRVLADDAQARQGLAPHEPDPALRPDAAAGTPPFSGRQLYVNPVAPARRQAVAWSVSRPDEATVMDRIASQPTGVWFGDWNQDVGAEADRVVSDAARRGRIPLLVAYNLPNRDCNQYSAGGVGSADEYRAWMAKLTEGIGAREAIVVLEPDALGLISCLTPADRAERLSLVREAVSLMKARTEAFVYIDAGHAGWVAPQEMAKRLHLAGVARADGFALNTSHFVPTDETIAHGEELSRRVGGAHFVIDTSRNGNPEQPGELRNPQDARLGPRPTTDTDHPLVDALLWIKPPGESDGPEHGGPPAGQWWPEYALLLARSD